MGGEEGESKVPYIATWTGNTGENLLPLHALLIVNKYWRKEKEKVGKIEKEDKGTLEAYEL